MWSEYVPRTFWSKVFAEDERDCTGKWLVPIPLGDPEGLWRRIEDAARSGRLIAVKRSAPELDVILGHHLACVYCRDSHESTVREALACLRELGATGDFAYKSDKATHENRDEKLYRSDVVERSSGKVHTTSSREV